MRSLELGGDDLDDTRVSELERKANKLEEENQYLYRTQGKRIRELESKFEDLMVEYKKVKQENSDIRKEGGKSTGELRALEKARDNFKDQCYDLKVELKELKGKLSRIESENDGI